MSEIITIAKLQHWLDSWAGDVNIFDSQFEEALAKELNLVFCDKPHWDNINEVYDRIHDLRG